MTPADRRPGELPPAMAWVGPGLTAFAGPAGSRQVGEPATIARAGDLEKAFGPGGGREVAAAVGAYFDAGGGPCVVLNLPAPASIPADRRPVAWIGEDGGPGYRTGILALLDREEVGTIAVPGLRDPDLRRRLLAALAGREDRFLVLDPVAGEERLPAADLAAVAAAGPGTAGEAPSGPYLAALEASDFREDRPEGALRVLAAGGHPTLGARYPSAEAWRLREGLRRSIDHGTRWVVFEQNGDLLRRRVEREVTAFLERLRRLGLLEGRTAEEAYRVRCRPPAAGRSAEGLLAIDVEVRLKGAGRPPAAGRAVSAGAARGEGT